MTSIIIALSVKVLSCVCKNTAVHRACMIGQSPARLRMYVQSMSRSFSGTIGRTHGFVTRIGLGSHYPELQAISPATCRRNHLVAQSPVFFT